MDRRRWRGRYTYPRGVWSEDIKNRFLDVLRETGNASEAGRRIGHMQMFRKRRKSDPEFAREWEEAVMAVDERLKGAECDFVGAGEGGASQAPGQALTPALSRNGRGSQVEFPTDAEALGGYLRPGRKRKSEHPEPVIRRTSNGRTQITLAREGHWTSEIEADFLARLRATGNFRRSALAVGFQPASVIARTRKWPAFKRACDEAMEEASVMLDYRLVAHAHALLRRPGEVEVEEERPSTLRPCSGEPSPFDAAQDRLGTNEENEQALPRPLPLAGGEEEDVPFDAEGAMRIIGFLDRRKEGRTGGKRRRGPPERSFEEAVESVLQKVEAIKKHKQMMQARGEAGEKG